MKLSVVVPVYNVEKYLKECIDSILAQTLKPLEIILVDDGSKDKSGQICDEYEKEYSCIKVIHKKNAGLGMARNTGIENSTGDYIIFIDSDDYIDSDYFEQMARIFEKEKCDTCKTSFRRVDIDGKFVMDLKTELDNFKGNEIKEKLIPRLIGSAPDKKDSLPMSSCCTIYSLKIIKENNLRFVSERVWISEDTLFNIEYYLKANFVIVSEYIGYNYRINQNSLTTKYMPQRFSKCIDMYNKEKEILETKNIYNLCRYRLDRQFFNYIQMCFGQLSRDVSGLDKKDIKYEMKKICNNELVKNIVNNYPVKYLGIKQKMFVFFVRKCMCNILYLYYCR